VIAAVLALDRVERPRTERAPGASDDEDLRAHRGLRCAACEAELTTDDERIEMSGAHAHTFVNPHGHVFEVGCFARVPGCVAVGPASAFFSWFPGYTWRVVVCGSCQAHLGWSFGETPDFFALVLNRLA